ncbi:MAG: glycyl-radical enzyme activating protein [Lachnospiraceae bacterium]|nr:glycyl-radical enzyme activating protein [Lachnospiraceae bacterium]
MKIKLFQKGFNYSQDGRGNRLILHLQGCNMHCPWCSNPEGMAPGGVLITEKEWLRESSCPKGAVQSGRLDRSVCQDCNDRPCIQKKRQKGIRLSYQEYEVSEVIRECIDSRPMFFDGGGVTLTGGEITLQFDAVKELLSGLKAAGINTAIESNGSHPRMREYLPLVDEWIMDIKHTDDKKHKEWIGVSNKQTLKTIQMATEEHGDVLLRIPLIPGFNDSREDAEGFASFFSSCAKRPNVRVEILAYHEFGKGKWEQCGYEYRMKPDRISPDTLQYFQKRFMDEGIHVVRT